MFLVREWQHLWQIWVWLEWRWLVSLIYHSHLPILHCYISSRFWVCLTIKQVHLPIPTQLLGSHHAIEFLMYICKTCRYRYEAIHEPGPIVYPHSCVVPYKGSVRGYRPWAPPIECSVMAPVWLLSCLFYFVGFAASSHFRGGIIQWRPVDARQFDGRVSCCGRWILRWLAWAG